MSKDISKFLSLVLRHDPGKIGIALDDNGWTPIDALVAKVRVAGHPKFDRAILDHIVQNSEKKRFSVSTDGLLIRAAQGHSITIDLGLQPSKPPAVLYHGTAVKNLVSIREHGLLPGKRQHVHLSKDYDTAITVGRRHGSPVVLTVAIAKMVEDGVLFYQADNGVWLTDVVLPRYLDFDPGSFDASA